MSRFFTLIFSLALASALTTPAEFFAQTPGLVNHPDQLAANQDAKSGRHEAHAGPGDEFVAFLHTGQTFFGRGDLMTARLVFIRPSREFAATGVGIYGRIFIPGPSGRYDPQGQIRYFYPEEGQNGFYPNINGSQVMRGYQHLISAGDPIGEYLLDFSIAESNGRLVQQVFARFHVLETGPGGKGIFSLTRALQPQPAQAGSQALVEGRLPANRKLDAFLGNPGYNWGAGGSVTDANGKYLTVYGLPPVVPEGYRGSTASWDVMVHIPELRECLLLPRAFEVVIPRFPSPQTQPQQSGGNDSTPVGRP